MNAQHHPPDMATPQTSREWGVDTAVSTGDSEIKITPIAPQWQCGLSATKGRSQQKRRLPANGRSIRAEILAGRRPRVGGGCITVKTDWKIHCPIASLVCPPYERSADGWEFSFLRGIEILLLYRDSQLDYVRSLIAELSAAGCSLVSAHVVPEVQSV
jgi:hypothetical protein